MEEVYNVKEIPISVDSYDVRHWTLAHYGAFISEAHKDGNGMGTGVMFSFGQKLWVLMRMKNVTGTESRRVLLDRMKWMTAEIRKGEVIDVSKAPKLNDATGKGKEWVMAYTDERVAEVKVFEGLPGDLL